MRILRLVFIDPIHHCIQASSIPQDKDIVTFLKEINMLEKIAMAWDQISPQTIRRSWRKLTPLEEAGNGADQEDLPSNTDLASTFQILGYECGEEDAQAWLG